MSEVRSEDYYFRGDELQPVLRAELFTDAGQLSEVGRREFRRICRIILHERGRPIAVIGPLFSEWKHDQLMELREPGYLHDEAIRETVIDSAYRGS